MLNKLTLKQALDKLRSKEISSEEITKDLLSAHQAQNKKLNIFLTLDDDPIKKAQKLDQKRNSNEDAISKHPLLGIPLAVKDNYCTRDLRTTASSTVLDEFKPQYESTVTTRTNQAGSFVFGKTNLDAWAHGSSTETSQYGRTLNPRNPDYLPGGSSGGSAAAIAADMTIASLGTETAGSIRQPASWCGTVGLKPTYGRVSRYGIIAMASSTDSPGPITKTVEDSAILLNTMAGMDKYDGTSAKRPVPDFTKSLNKDIKDLKIGILYKDIEGLQEVWPQFEKQLQVLENLGAKIEHVSALDPHHAISVYTILQRGEVSSNLGRFDGIRYGHDRSYFGHEAKNRIMLGTYTLSKGYADAYYNTAQKVRTLFAQDFEKLFSKYDLLISPTSPGFAKKIGASENSAMFGELEDMLLEPSSITGLPGISVPCYRDPETNLFLGMNIMAPMWREDLVIQVGDAFEKNTKWNTWRN